MLVPESNDPVASVESATRKCGTFSMAMSELATHVAAGGTTEDFQYRGLMLYNLPDPTTVLIPLAVCMNSVQEEELLLSDYVLRKALPSSTGQRDVFKRMHDYSMTPIDAELISQLLFATFVGLYPRCSVRANMETRRRALEFWVGQSARPDIFTLWCRNNIPLLYVALREYLAYAVEMSDGYVHFRRSFYAWDTYATNLTAMCDDLRTQFDRGADHAEIRLTLSQWHGVLQQSLTRPLSISPWTDIIQAIDPDAPRAERKNTLSASPDATLHEIIEPALRLLLTEAKPSELRRLSLDILWPRWPQEMRKILNWLIDRARPPERELFPLPKSMQHVPTFMYYRCKKSGKICVRESEKNTYPVSFDPFSGKVKCCSKMHEDPNCDSELELLDVLHTNALRDGNTLYAICESCGELLAIGETYPLSHRMSHACICSRQTTAATEEQRAKLCYSCSKKATQAFATMSACSDEIVVLKLCDDHALMQRTMHIRCTEDVRKATIISEASRLRSSSSIFASALWRWINIAPELDYLFGDAHAIARAAAPMPSPPRSTPSTRRGAIDQYISYVRSHGLFKDAPTEDLQHHGLIAIGRLCIAFYSFALLENTNSTAKNTLQEYDISNFVIGACNTTDRNLATIVTNNIGQPFLLLPPRPILRSVINTNTPAVILEHLSSESMREFRQNLASQLNID